MRLPVCETCNDTHWMSLRGELAMCTSCPLPCSTCRRGGIGGYCAETPCKCTCHRRGAGR